MEIVSRIESITKFGKSRKNPFRIYNFLPKFQLFTFYTLKKRVFCVIMIL